MKTLNLHNYYLNKIKNLVGASYVGYEQQGNLHKIKITIPGKKPDYFDVVGHPQNATIETYEQVLKIVENYYNELL